MKRRVATRSEPVQHEMDVTQLDHRSTRFYFSLIVLAVSPVPTMPGIRSLNHPAFRQRREPLRSRWTRLHCDSPTSSMLGDPGFEVVIVILLIREDRDQTWKVLGIDLAEQGQGRH